MKKRTIIAILITIIAIVTINNFCLNLNPLILGFDFMIFSIVLILVFLFVYKLTDYVSKFSTTQNKPIVDVIFLTIFFIFLLIPSLHINKDEISQKENRTLAKWKPFITQNKTINYSFGNDFNEWFNDRFNLRQVFLDIHDLKLLLSKNWKTKDVLKGNNDWLFLGWKESRDSYTNRTKFTDRELEDINNYLKSIDNYCKNNNKNFYFFIAPDKSRIYPEYYPKSIRKISDTTRAEQLIEYIKRHSNVKVIYPKDKLISQKGDDLLYWKNDTHWNLLGAYYGYSELMNVIKKDYSDLSLYKVFEYSTEIHTGDLEKMSPTLLRKKDNTIYTIPKINYKNICEQSGDLRSIVECSNSKSNVNLLMYRDSFAMSLIPYLSNTFGQSKYIWKYEVNPNEMKNADIIILEVIERYIPALTRKKWRYNNAI